jgi:DNA polymerase III delta prime subunit
MLGGAGLWVDRHRPDRLEGIAGQKAVDKLRQLVARGIGGFPNVLLYGPPGTGKTTAALACMRELYLDDDDRQRMVLLVNASNDRGISTVRDTILGFVQTQALFGKRQPKCVVLDEVDAMTVDAQCALRVIMESNAALVRFVLLCNDTTKLMGALLSRCTRLRFRPLGPSMCAEFLQGMATAEGLELDPEAARAVVAVCSGDMRRAVNLLQNVASIPPAVSEPGSEVTTAITAKAVYVLSGRPSPADVQTLFECLAGPESCHGADLPLVAAVNSAAAFLVCHQVALSEVLDLLAVCVLQKPPSTPRAAAVLLSSLCDIQWRLTNIGVREGVQLAAVAAVFADAYRGLRG